MTRLEAIEELKKGNTVLAERDGIYYKFLPNGTVLGQYDRLSPKWVEATFDQKDLGQGFKHFAAGTFTGVLDEYK